MAQAVPIDRGLDHASQNAVRLRAAASRRSTGPHGHGRAILRRTEGGRAAMAEGIGAPIEAREAFETLVHLAQRRVGRIPPDLLARHVLECYADADWPVQRAALEALLRRIEFAHRDGLRVTARPEDVRDRIRRRPRHRHGHPSPLSAGVPLREAGGAAGGTPAARLARSPHPRAAAHGKDVVGPL
jgi:hypothetical protein